MVLFVSSVVHRVIIKVEVMTPCRAHSIQLVLDRFGRYWDKIDKFRFLELFVSSVVAFGNSSAVYSPYVPYLYHDTCL